MTIMSIWGARLEGGVKKLMTLIIVVNLKSGLNIKV